MSAVLRAHGASFDVDQYLLKCTFPVCAVYHKGERKARKESKQNGFNADMSNAGFDPLAKQVKDVIAFVRKHRKELRRLLRCPGVKVSIDFGVAWRDVIVQSDYLPSELVRLAGELGLAIQVSHYPISDKEEAGKETRPARIGKARD
jgi:hypothetical protein